MPEKSATVKRAVSVEKAKEAELADLRAAIGKPIDTSDSPEHRAPFRRIRRDPQGRLPQPVPGLRDSPIRTAILKQLGRLQMNRYQLWRRAQAYCPSLTASAVYEYLRGQREIGLPYAEALMKAAGLTLKASPRAPKTKGAGKKAAKPSTRTG